MKDLQKINLLQLHQFWKNLSIAILLLILLLTVSTWSDSIILSIIISTVSASIIYWRIYTNKTGHHPTYVLVGYALMMSIIIFTLFLITLSLLSTSRIFDINSHIPIFIGKQKLSALILAPVCFATMGWTYIRRRAIHRYLDKHFGVNNDIFLKGKLGALLTRESRAHALYLMMLFGILSVINWTYYIFFFYKDASLNNQDIYIFYWVNLIGLILYLTYLLIHNYSLELDLRQSNTLITPQEAENLVQKNYFRFFVICNNHLFVSHNCDDPDYTAHKVVDTPFFLKCTGSMPPISTIQEMIYKSTGTDQGELRFFFSFKAPGLNNHTVLRYFYFLKGDCNDYPTLDQSRGEWMTMEQLEELNSRKPHALSSYLLADALRLITIIKTEKLYNEKGFRKYKIKSYTPAFRLQEIQKTDIDFQSDKWLEIAVLNADKPLFRLRKLLKNTKKARNQ